MAESNKVVVILGPTATGKTKVGVRLASKFNGEIISADSRQVYKGMDVGTGKDLKEYIVRSPESRANKIKYHLIDVVSPKADFNVAKFQKLAYAGIDNILARGKTPIIVGGTGLYINAVVEGYQFNQVHSPESTVQSIRKKLDKLSLKQLLARLKKVDPKTFKIIDQKNRRRVQRAMEIYLVTGKTKFELDKKVKPPYQFLKIGLNYPADVLKQRISKRLIERLEHEDMVGEVKRLHRQGLSWRRLEGFGLEYDWLARYCQKKISYDEMVVGLQKAIVDFTRRQWTWFKRDKKIIWENRYVAIEKRVKKFLN